MQLSNRSLACATTPGMTWFFQWLTFALAVGYVVSPRPAEPWPDAEPALAPDTAQAAVEIDVNGERRTVHIAEPLRRRLSSGARANAIVHVEVEDESGAFTRIRAGACAVALDLWDEVYAVFIPDRAQEAKPLVAPTLPSVVARCFDPTAYASEKASVRGAITREIFKLELR